MMIILYIYVHVCAKGKVCKLAKEVNDQYFLIKISLAVSSFDNKTWYF